MHERLESREYGWWLFGSGAYEHMSSVVLIFSGTVVLCMVTLTE